MTLATSPAIFKSPYAHQPGGHCASVAWSGVFRSAGFRYDETDIFGIGGGLFFGYVAVSNIKRFNIILSSTNLINNLIANTGVYMMLHQISDNQRAFDELAVAIESGCPVAVELNPAYCEALSFLGDQVEHLPLHWVLVTGIDFSRGVVTLYENSQFNPLEMSIDRFMDGRNSGERWKKNPKNFYYHTVFPEKLFPFEVSLKLSLENVLHQYLLTEKFGAVYTGEYGFEKLIRQCPLWNMMLDSDSLRNTVQRINMAVTGARAVKGGYRLLYAQFLERSAKKVPHSGLTDAAGYFREAATGWREFSVLLDESLNVTDLKKYWKDVAGFGPILSGIYQKEKEAIDILSKVVQEIKYFA